MYIYFLYCCYINILFCYYILKWQIYYRQYMYIIYKPVYSCPVGLFFWRHLTSLAPKWKKSQPCDEPAHQRPFQETLHTPRVYLFTCICTYIYRIFEERLKNVKNAWSRKVSCYTLGEIWQSLIRLYLKRIESNTNETNRFTVCKTKPDSDV